MNRIQGGACGSIGDLVQVANKSLQQVITWSQTWTRHHISNAYILGSLIRPHPLRSRATRALCRLCSPKCPPSFALISLTPSPSPPAPPTSGISRHRGQLCHVPPPLPQSSSLFRNHILCIDTATTTPLIQTAMLSASVKSMLSETALARPSTSTLYVTSPN